jgi:hypothetical protein
VHSRRQSPRRGDFRTVEDWRRHLDAFAERLANPVWVTVGQGGAGRAAAG